MRLCDKGEPASPPKVNPFYYSRRSSGTAQFYNHLLSTPWFFSNYLLEIFPSILRILPTRSLPCSCWRAAAYGDLTPIRRTANVKNDFRDPKLEPTIVENDSLARCPDLQTMCTVKLKSRQPRSKV